MVAPMSWAKLAVKPMSLPLHPHQRQGGLTLLLLLVLLRLLLLLLRGNAAPLSWLLALLLLCGCVSIAAASQ
jgi:hypothetical protein